jgi:GGDEF domain-containing protein
MVTVGASIGIAMFPLDADSADTLISASDEAMYQAKILGKNQYFFFDRQLTENHAV